ncbi:MAG TPA: TIM barrel protein, partial [Planctomicrobium sp.]|nr:TIM barrel protein [Planctomicrobium sp.]
MRIKISVPTSALQRDLRKAIHTAMQLGAHGVQFDLRSEVTADHFGDSARRQLQTYLSERNLELASGHFPLNRPLAEPERLDQRLAALNSAIALASKLKIRCLTLQPGELPDVESLQRGILLQILSELATQANLHGVTL